MWRNGRRNGLKIAVLAFVLLFKIDQIEPNLPLVNRPRSQIFAAHQGGVKTGSFLHKFLHTAEDQGGV